MAQDPRSTILTATVSAPQSPVEGVLHFGANRSPSGETVSADSSSLLLNGKAWTPVMGEFHYSRVPVEKWRSCLLKAKAGGIDVVATYVFWIHHEEIEGQWDWSGQRDLRRFVQLAGELGLKVVIRGGPWCHGEVRNGGLPEWLVTKGLRLRSNDPAYLEPVRRLYAQTALQLKGLLWKDGGPVVALQLENEYGGAGDHLLLLKTLALEAGLDVPLYTRTGWPELKTSLPAGEIFPLYGAYAEGFWDRTIGEMPGKYWSGFHFSALRVDTNIANEALGRREAKDAADIANYPYLTCELGGGMMSSYHRRILVDPLDIESIAVVKLGSGSNLLGYYMYQGGTNPQGRASSLNEAQATSMTNYNDLPVKNYDFQAPVGAEGQLRPQYHRLRRLHLFLREFGAGLASMKLTLPDQRVAGKDDLGTLRWSVRSDGEAGYLFINNHERGRLLAPKDDLRFSLRMPKATLEFPSKPVRVASDEVCFWPFNFELGHGVRVLWATAQPVCSVDEGKLRTVFFAAPSSGSVQVAIAGEAESQSFQAGRGVAKLVKGEDGGSVQLVFLSQEDSLSLWKGEWRGSQRVFLTKAGLLLDGESLKLESFASEPVELSLYPAPVDLPCGARSGVFSTLLTQIPPAARYSCGLEVLRAAGPSREIKAGAAGMAEQPYDAAFESAAAWRVRLPDKRPLAEGGFLRVQYVGDVARLKAGGVLVGDDFFNGSAWDFGSIAQGAQARTELELEILPLSQSSVDGEGRKIYMQTRTIPAFKERPALVDLQSVDYIEPGRIEFE